jgi:hypothetical protein
MAECSSDITPYAGKNWMNLYIDVDSGYNGWETFDYVVSKKDASDNQASLDKFSGNGYETSKVSGVDYKVSGNRIVVKIAKSDLGLSGNEYKLGFKWTDNVQDEDGSGEFKGEILDFYRTGDVAPGGRFKYVYKFTGSAEVEPVTSTEATSAPADDTNAPETTNNITEPENKNNGTVILIIVIAAAVIAVCASVAVILKNRKK